MSWIELTVAIFGLCITGVCAILLMHREGVDAWFDKQIEYMKRKYEESKRK